MSSSDNVALKILMNLGLTEEMASILENEKLESQNSVYMRGDEGLGYRKTNANPILEADQIFARLSSNNSNDNLYKTSIGSVPVSTNNNNNSGFNRLPKRLIKRSVKDYTDKDLAVIFNQTNKEEVVDAKEEGAGEGDAQGNRRRRRKSIDS